MSKLEGNPVIVATNGRYNVIRRGEEHYYYTTIKIGIPLSRVRKWYGKELLNAVVDKGGYKVLEPPKPYTED